MKQYIKRMLLGLAVVVGLGISATMTPTANAQVNVFQACQGSNGTSQVCGANGSNTSDAPTLIKSVINILLYIIGIIAVVTIIIGGIRYVTSNGDSGNIKSAKDTILYAVVGLVVAIMAFAIVNFVVKAFK